MLALLKFDRTPTGPEDFNLTDERNSSKTKGACAYDFVHQLSARVDFSRWAEGDLVSNNQLRS